MLPGKKYKPEDFVRIAWTRKWFIVLPLLVTTIGAVAYAQMLPNRYRAQTSILIIPQQVPQSYVQSTVTTLLADRLQMISQQILSRTRLERIIDEFKLYPELRSHAIMEDVVERMRTQDIKVQIQPNRRQSDSGAFTVGFEASDPRTALLVTERLASLFIRENLEDRSILAESTNQFLEAQLEEARRRLVDHEKKLEDYKRRNAGSLPTQVQSNLQAMQNAQLQLQSMQQDSNRDRDRRLFLERALSDLQAEPEKAAMPVIDPQDPASAQQVPAAIRLEAARALLRGLELRLKPEHPDIMRAKRMIRDLEKDAEKEALGRPISEGPNGAATAAEKMRQARITAVQLELEMLDRRIAGRHSDEQRVRGELAQYQQRVQAAPALESDLTELMRDYDTLKTSYDDLLRKSEASKLAVNLERRQIGEQFKIIDAARLPQRPVSPDRPRLIGLGAVAGLGIGLVLVALLEYRDSSLKTDEDVVLSLALPVLALIPEMVTKEELRAARRRRRLLAATSVAGIVIAAGVAVWKLELLDRWIG